MSGVWCERWKERDGIEEGAPKLMKNKRRPRATEAVTAAVTKEEKEGWESQREGRGRSVSDTHRAAAPALGGAKSHKVDQEAGWSLGRVPSSSFPERRRSGVLPVHILFASLTARTTTVPPPANFNHSKRIVLRTFAALSVSTLLGSGHSNLGNDQQEHHHWLIMLICVT